MKCYWSPAARDDRYAIWHYNLNFGIEEAKRVDDLIEDAVRIIMRAPYSGVTGRYPGTYEHTPEPTLRVIYELRTEGSLILAVMHAAFALSDLTDTRPPFRWS